MNVSFNGYGQQVATFEAGSSVQAGCPVMISSNGQIGSVGTGGDFCGICLSVENGYAAVQMKGYVRQEYTGTITPGRMDLTGAADGKVKNAGAGDAKVSVLVIDVDSTAKVCGFIL